MHKAQTLINHVALVLDASSSMIQHHSKLVSVADDQIRHLALRSEELGQETRVSVYTFSDHVTCQIFDMDVMRLPSIKDLYSAYGMTALVDATIKSQQDLETTSQIYGDHAFLTFVLTDGAENKSRNSWRALARYIGKSNWSIGFLVPNSQGEAYVQRAGILKDNISIWDASSAKGLSDSFSDIRQATDRFMTNRASGIKTSGVFSTGPENVNKTTVHSLKPLSGYVMFFVDKDQRIDDFVTSKTGRYSPGDAFYQLTKRVTIQPYKQIVIVEKSTGKMYGGSDARNLIGLPDRSVKVSPNTNPDYTVFVQSTSLNRKVFGGTSVMVRT